jgi:hypothetical protein
MEGFNAQISTDQSLCPVNSAGARKSDPSQALFSNVTALIPNTLPTTGYWVEPQKVPPKVPAFVQLGNSPTANPAESRLTSRFPAVAMSARTADTEATHSRTATQATLSPR